MPLVEIIVVLEPLGQMGEVAHVPSVPERFADIALGVPRVRVGLHEQLVHLVRGAALEGPVRLDGHVFGQAVVAGHVLVIRIGCHRDTCVSCASVGGALLVRSWCGEKDVLLHSG